jgi:hypothetical protein
MISCISLAYKESASELQFCHPSALAHSGQSLVCCRISCLSDAVMSRVSQTVGSRHNTGTSRTWT